MSSDAQRILSHCDELFGDGRLYRWKISDGSDQRIPKGQACIEMGKFLPDNVKTALKDHWQEIEPFVRRRLETHS